MDYRDIYNDWCKNEYFDEETRKELIGIQDNDKEIYDRFYKELEFGTGGLRGVIGNGTNRMNVYTVRKATQGLANYIIRQNGMEKGVAIAYDSRRMSPEFASEAALCLNANQIKTYIFPSLRPTPQLSFAVRELGCIAGIVITASHNPPEYNGYKVYWEDGAQITAPKDQEIISEVRKVADYRQVRTMAKEEAEKCGLYRVIGSEIDDRYIEEVKKQSVLPDITAQAGEDFKIVYTPLHGTGNLPVRRVLKELGFSQVYVVPEQEMPDPDFRTLSYPNPEDPSAFKLALELAREKGADVVLATDPDADRLGIYARDKETGEYISFTGNMSGMLIAEYILSVRQEQGTLPENGALVETIVTTNMGKAMAGHYGIALIEVLTGFKYIGEQIKLFEENHTYQYIFGLEESYGCLAGTYARDKDAIVAVMLLCEAAAYYKTKGLTLVEQMDNLYKKYGYYKEGLSSVTLKGAEGAGKIQEIIDGLRQNPPHRIGDFQVVASRDYKSGVRTVFGEKETEPVGLPKSNVLYYELAEDAWCCVRPSGTEPKIKFYYGVKGKDSKDADAKLQGLADSLQGLAAL